MGSRGCPNNLPQQLTSFVGREQEQARVRSAVGSTRLLVLTGAGGAGKTRLALKVAADSADFFPDGRWWVELAPLTAADPLGAALAAVLGVRPLPGRTPVEAAIAALGNDAVLVVLDNCEHVAEAAAQLAEALLRGCPRAVVLATSRVPLDVPGETDWLVPSLALPEEAEHGTPELVAGSDAGRLFVERAGKVRPDFILNAANTTSVARICRDLDGIPLAIELAAAWVRLLSVEQIGAALSDRFRLLTGGPRAALPRHRTLRASVDWSYALLAEAERRLFRRLAVFVGGWSLDAIESVCAGDGLDRDEILGVLASLVDKSLVEVVAHEQVARYRLLETLRQYALELLQDSDEFAGLRDRHLAFFLALAERAAAELDLPRNLVWLDLLEPDAANFDAAIGHALECDPERALRMGIALTSWWELGGRFAAGQNHLARALETAGQAPSALRARGLWSCGHLARFRGDAEAVGRYLPQALELAESIGDDATTARALVTLGHVRMHPDPQGSRQALTRAMELGRKTGDAWTLNLALNTLGRTYIVTDDKLREGELLFHEALATAVRTGPDAVCWAASGLAWTAMFRAEHERCTEFCERAAAAARQLGEPVTEAFAHSIWVLDATLQGHGTAALERALANEARVIAAGAGFTFPIVRTELARAHATLGNLETARALLQVVVAGGADGAWLLCRAMLLLGEVLLALGDVDGAVDRARDALELSARVGACSLSATGREVLARVAMERGEWSSADALAHEALAMRVQIGALPWLPQSLDRLAQIAAGREAHVDAARLLGAAQRARADLGLARWPPDAPAFDALGRVLAVGLGVDGYEAARAEGTALTVDEATGWALRAHGTRKRPTRGWEALTPTELQVAELIARGLTNPQVAARMFISTGTAKIHLEHIFQKLGIHSRAELAATTARRAP